MNLCIPVVEIAYQSYDCSLYFVWQFKGDLSHGSIIDHNKGFIDHQILSRLSAQDGENDIDETTFGVEENN